MGIWEVLQWVLGSCAAVVLVTLTVAFVVCSVRAVKTFKDI